MKNNTICRELLKNHQSVASFKGFTENLHIQIKSFFYSKFIDMCLVENKSLTVLFFPRFSIFFS